VGLLATLQAKTKDELINDAINAFVEEWADDRIQKRIPYIGAYWRDTDFVGKHITIGKMISDIGEYVGVMENNKWEYPERLMTEQEVDTFVGFIDRAYDATNQNEREEAFMALRHWFQSLEV
jgi:hypothetical protein